VKSSYRFEIVRRRSDRFGWRVVAIDDAGRRVIGRSERSYRSRKKATKAINALRAAYVDDTTRPPDGFPLPATKFEVVPGVLPLIVAEHPVEYAPAVRGRGGGRAENDATPEQYAQAQTAVQAPPGERLADPRESAADSEESATEAKGQSKPGRRAKKTK
jgi:uncharacterized protein YegP (UPF0339 family)